MDATAFLDQFITDEMELDPADSYVTAEWRTWLLRKLNKVARRRWDSWDWDFRFATDTTLVTVPSEGTVELPADFLRFGDHGFACVPRFRKIEPKVLGFVREAQNAPVSPAFPLYCAVEFQSSTAPLLLLAPIPAQAESITVYYERKLPEITDASADSGLDAFPEEFVSAVILPAMRVEYFRRKREDDALAEAKQELAEALIEMKVRYRQDHNVIPVMGDVGLSDLGMW